jgi:hypothetical protein
MDRVDLTTGRREPLVTARDRDSRFPVAAVFFAMADDSHVYAYVAATHLSQIFTVDGVR